MIVLRTIESFFPRISGPANQAFRISFEMEKLGIHSPIYTSNFGAKTSPAVESMDSVSVHRFPVKGKLLKYCYSPSMSSELRKDSQKVPFDIIHAHNYRSYQVALGYRVAKERNKPFVISTHGSMLGYHHFVKGWQNKMPYILYDLFTAKKAVLGSDAVVVSSNFEKKDALMFGVPEDKIHIIPAGIDSEKYTPQPRKGHGKINLLFVGRISRNRNIEALIEAMRLLDPKKYHLNIVGGEEKSSDTSKTGYLTELMVRVHSLGLKNITFKGPQYGSRLIQEYLDSDIFVYPSVYENFGQTLLEAGASGLPLVCTNVGIAQDLVREGKTGYFIDMSPTSIKTSIENLGDSRTRKVMGDRLRAIIKKDYKWSDISKRYRVLYEKLS